MYRIEKGIALPPARWRIKKRKKPYPFLKMKIGDSFMVPLSEGQTTAALQRKLTSRSSWETRIQRMKFATRVVRKGDVYMVEDVAHEEKADGVRIWRTK
jgi:hypothetical protein